MADSGWARAAERTVTVLLGGIGGFLFRATTGTETVTPHWRVLSWSLLAGALLATFTLGSVFVARREKWKRDVLGAEPLVFWRVDEVLLRITIPDHVGLRLEVTLSVCSDRHVEVPTVFSVLLIEQTTGGVLLDAESSLMEVEQSPAQLKRGEQQVRFRVTPREERRAEFQRISKEIWAGTMVRARVSWKGMKDHAENAVKYEVFRP